MYQHESAELEAENQAETETLGNEADQTDEDLTEGDVVKQEGTDYAAELADLQAKLAKKDEIIEHKNRAITALKERPKAEEPQEGDVDIDGLIERKLAKRLPLLEAEGLIRQLARSEDHAKLIKFHMEHSIVPSGNTTQDVENATLLADKPRLKKELASYKEALVSASTAYGAQYGGHKKHNESKLKATPEDIRIAQKMFRGDVDRYLKYKNK